MSPPLAFHRAVDLLELLLAKTVLPMHAAIIFESRFQFPESSRTMFFAFHRIRECFFTRCESGMSIARRERTLASDSGTTQRADAGATGWISADK
jgi:hypothetical protein